MSGINQATFEELVSEAKDNLADIKTTISSKDYDLSDRVDMAVDGVMNRFVYAKDVFEFMAKNDAVMCMVQPDYGMLSEPTADNACRLAIRETLRDAVIKELENAELL